VGEHYHPAIVERFTTFEGELNVKYDGRTSVLSEGETAVVEAGVCHDWWNATDRDVRVRTEITLGARFLHMIETLFGLARLGCTNAKDMPQQLQLAPVAREFADTIVFRSPPQTVQRVLFGMLTPLARMRGYRATYPQLSCTALAPRS
jgi:hypothetical protein